MKELSEQLEKVVTENFESLKNINDIIAAKKPAPGKWSVKEIIGHLIDSAANNHQRFIRTQQEKLLLSPRYEQEFWVASQYYNDEDWQALLNLWKYYNLHLAYIIKYIPVEHLNNECRIGDYEPCTLQYLAEDYVRHLNHHLSAIDALINS